ncbi:hypothetical protein [Roseivirga pacifica]
MKEYLKNFNPLDYETSESFGSFFSDLKPFEKVELIELQLFNILKLEADNLGALKDVQVDQTSVITKSIKKRYMLRLMNKITDKYGLCFPKAYVSSSFTLTIIVLTILWLTLAIMFLLDNIEILLFGFEILIAPFAIIISGLPYLFFYFFFPDFVAVAHFKDVKTFNQLVEILMKENWSHIKEMDYSFVINHLSIIRKQKGVMD